MFVRKKTNRSGTISVVVVSKARGKFTEVKRFGVAKSEEEADDLYQKALGARKENILMLDSKGVITDDREKLTPEKQEFATPRRDVHTLEEAVEGADVFLGLSKGGVLSQDMVRSMADMPIVFALANPEPEITYEQAMEARQCSWNTWA